MLFILYSRSFGVMFTVRNELLSFTFRRHVLNVSCSCCQPLTLTSWASRLDFSSFYLCFCCKSVSCFVSCLDSYLFFYILKTDPGLACSETTEWTKCLWKCYTHPQPTVMFVFFPLPPVQEVQIALKQKYYAFYRQIVSFCSKMK